MPTIQPRLHRAAAHGGVAQLKQYLTAGDAVNARDVDGRTALLWAVVGDQIDSAKLLLAAGANRERSGVTQLVSGTHTFAIEE